MLWACCIGQGHSKNLANDKRTHENKISTFLFSGDGNLTSNEVQVNSDKSWYSTKKPKDD